MVYRWAVFVKLRRTVSASSKQAGPRDKSGWSMEAYIESTSFSNAAHEAGAEFRKLKEIHPDKLIKVVKIFDSYEPSGWQ